MSLKYIQLLRNITYALTSNLISLLISMLAIIIVPKLIGIEEYGYWQLYIFYSSFIGFMHFGLSDGIYLKEGGKSYNEIDKEVMFNQIVLLSIMQFVFAVIIILVSRKLINNDNKQVIMVLFSISMVVTNIRSVPIFILLATNRIKEYANVVVFDRITYFILVIFTLIFGLRNFENLIFAEILGRIISLLISFYYCKEIFIRPVKDFKTSFLESYNYMRAGIQLMLAYILSLLVIGVVRFGIESVWDVKVFGKISLILSASSLMMLFINALGLILFPILRRTNYDKLSEIYLIIRNSLMVLLLGLLMLYYPLKTLLELWLPRYAESLKYMSFVFPIFVFEGNTGLLINTYMKTIRKEGLMLRINLVTLFLSIGLTILNAYVLKNLELTVLSIVVLLAFKSIFSEIFLSKILKIKLTFDFIFEIALILVFITAGWFINSWMTTYVYCSAYLIYLFLKRNNFSKTLTFIIDSLKIKIDES